MEAQTRRCLRNRCDNIMLQPLETHNNGKIWEKMGKVDTSYLMMIPRRVTNISSRSHIIVQLNSTHTTKIPRANNLTCYCTISIWSIWSLPFPTKVSSIAARAPWAAITSYAKCQRFLYTIWSAVSGMTLAVLYGRSSFISPSQPFWECTASLQRRPKPQFHLIWSDQPTIFFSHTGHHQ